MLYTDIVYSKHMLQALQSTDACTADLPAICVQNKLQCNKMALAPNHVLETSRSKVNSPGVSEVETALQLHLLWMWSGPVHGNVVVMLLK